MDRCCAPSSSSSDTAAPRTTRAACAPTIRPSGSTGNLTSLTAAAAFVLLLPQTHDREVAALCRTSILDRTQQVKPSIAAVAPVRRILVPPWRASPATPRGADRSGQDRSLQPGSRRRRSCLLRDIRPACQTRRGRVLRDTWWCVPCRETTSTNSAQFRLIGSVASKDRQL